MGLKIVEIASHVPQLLDVETELVGKVLSARDWPLTMAQFGLQLEPGMEMADMPFPADFRERLSVGGARPEQPFSTEDDAQTFAAMTGIHKIAIASHETASDLASKAVHQLRLKLQGRGMELAPDYIIYCHATPDEIGQVNPVFRIQHEIGREAAVPFAVSQNDIVSTGVGLELAHDLWRSGAATSVLLVAADKWLLPAVRRFGGLSLVSDGAAAALLATEAAFGIELIDIVTAGGDAPLDVFSLPKAAIDRLPEDYAVRAAKVVESLLERNVLHVRDIDAFASTAFNKSISTAAYRRLDVDPANVIDPSSELSANFSNADLLIRLEEITARRPSAENQTRLLFWTIGIRGDVVAILARMDRDRRTAR